MAAVRSHVRNASSLQMHPARDESWTPKPRCPRCTDLRPLLQRQHTQLEGAHTLILEVGGVVVGLAQRKRVCRGSTN